MAEMSRPGGPQLHSFPGGLELPDNKSLATGKPIQLAPVPREVILPLNQHIGEPAVPVVDVGAHVLRGQMIARIEGPVGATLHASTSGTVTAITERLIPHPSGLSATCIVIEADGTDEAIEFKGHADWQNLEPARIRKIVRDAGIVGLGGAAFPSWIKLNGEAHPGLDRLIINGAECEPYICCDDMLMRERADDVVSGARIMMRAVGVKRCQIAIESNKPEAEAALRKALEKKHAENIELITVPSVYPEGGEKQLIQVLTGKEVPHDGLPLDIGIVCHNVGTAAAVHRAVVRGEPLISRIVTVTGRGVAEPCNIEARIGTLFRDLVEFCGGYTENAERLIMGGPMMGFAIRSDEVPVIKATNCILVPDANEVAPPRDAMPCIRCGECAEACPASLLPQTLYWHTKAREFEKVQEYDIFDCIECGCCDIVCPSHIPLVSYFRFAKTEIWGKETERAKADHARQRHEFRQARIEREKQEQEEKRRKKQEALEKMKSADARKSEIEAALERAKKKSEK